MPLPSLPLDVLLAVFRNLDIFDVVHIGMTCKDLHGAVQDRHVWADQLERLRQDDPVPKSATPPLTSLSVHELKTFVIGRIKLRLLWDRGDEENGFATMGLIGVPEVCELKLLPGGKSVLVINGRGGVTLRRIELEDGQVSLPVVANVKYDQGIIAGLGWNKLLTAMSPSPVLVHRQGNNMHLVRIDHHDDAMSLETTFPLPEGYSFLQANGQGRVVGFLIQMGLEPPRAVIIHLDYPGITAEFGVSPAYSLGTGLTSYLWGFCIPTENLVVIYNTLHILAWRIPDFSSLSRSVSLTGATPTWYWPGLDQSEEVPHYLVHYMAGEAIHDPTFAREFSLHYVCRLLAARAITITIPINTNGDIAEPPALKQKITPIKNHGRYSDGVSCQKGLHFDMVYGGDGVDYLVTPLKDLASESKARTLRMSVPYTELKHSSRTNKIDMDEATGRVVIWGWDKGETKVFVGDLV